MTSFRTILSKVPIEDRTSFLEGMSFANGTLINLDLAPIRGALPDEEIEALMQECGTDLIGYACDPKIAGQCFKSTAHTACNATACKGSKGATLVQLGGLLEETPSHPRKHFLDSLTFQRGQLVDADHSVIEEHLDEAARTHLPRARA
jgi:hypothetical protein